jgi:phage gp29-like protein
MSDDKNTPARPPLDSEVASQAQDPFSTIFMGILRTNDPLLMERGMSGTQAHELYRDLRRDGKVFSGLQKRKLAVVSREWTVEPVVESDQGVKDAEVVNDILGGFAFDQLCNDLMDALLVGWQPTEVIWTLRDVTVGGVTRQMVVPARVVKRSHRRFVYVQDEGQPFELRLLTRDDMQRGMALPDRKFIVHRVNAEDDNPYGTGVGLQLYWPVYFKRKGVLAWTKFLDRFGLPIPWGKYPSSASAREKGTLFEALRAVSNDGLIMTPDSTEIELLESKLSGSATPHQAHVEFMDDWIMEVILGQSPRGKSGGALAAASNEREDVRLELSQADSDLLSETLNGTLIRWICELNGLEPCLVYRRVEKEEDLKASSETDLNVKGLGFEMSVEGVKSKYGEHWERSAPPPVLPPPSPGSGNGPPASFAEGDPSAPDAIDRLVSGELAQWRAVAEPMAAPLRALLERASTEKLTAGELLERLPDVLAQMDDGQLVQALTGLAYAARLAGNAGGERV